MACNRDGYGFWTLWTVRFSCICKTQHYSKNVEYLTHIVRKERSWSVEACTKTTVLNCARWYMHHLQGRRKQSLHGPATPSWKRFTPCIWSVLYVTSQFLCFEEGALSPPPTTSKVAINLRTKLANVPYEVWTRSHETDFYDENTRQRCLTTFVWLHCLVSIALGIKITTSSDEKVARPWPDWLYQSPVPMICVYICIWTVIL